MGRARAFRIWIFALAVFSTSALAHAARPLEFHLLSKVTLEGVEYTVAILRPSPEGSVVGEGERRFASSVVRRAEEWIATQYQERYPDRPNEFFGQMFRENPMNDGHSAIVVVGRGRDLWEIDATLRISTPESPTGKVPSEKLFGFEFSRPVIEMGLHTEGKHLWTESSKEAKSLALVGSVKEFKNLVMRKGQETDLLPLLFFMAERAGLSDQAANYTIESLSETLGRRFAGDPNVRLPVYPSRYLLTADETTTKLYQRWGWEFDRAAPVADSDYSMVLSRERYLERMLETIRRRPGFRAIVDTGRHESYLDRLGKSSVAELAAFFSVPECTILLRNSPEGTIRLPGFPALKFPRGMNVEMKVKSRGAF